jgi:hypothetical protein
LDRDVTGIEFVLVTLCIKEVIAWLKRVAAGFVCIGISGVVGLTVVIRPGVGVIIVSGRYETRQFVYFFKRI